MSKVIKQNDELLDGRLEVRTWWMAGVLEGAVLRLEKNDGIDVLVARGPFASTVLAGQDGHGPAWLADHLQNSSSSMLLAGVCSNGQIAAVVWDVSDRVLGTHALLVETLDRSQPVDLNGALRAAAQLAGVAEWRVL